MDKKVLIIDTSILCVWLRVRDMEVCGPDQDRWNFDRVNDKIKVEESVGTTFVLPLASIIETGNHIAHANGDIYDTVDRFVSLIKDSANEVSPWAAFTEQSSLWTADMLVSLAEKWRGTAVSGQSLGDASIVEVAKYYRKAGFRVEILTGDEGLKAYEPQTNLPQPRRRR